MTPRRESGYKFIPRIFGAASDQDLEQYYLDLISGRRRGLWAGCERAALRLAALPYGWGVRIRNQFFENGWKASVFAKIPVVSVGNLTVGGTGKTPCVEYVARFFRDLDYRVAILSRGYGAEQGRNDEAMVLEENLPDVPHLQGPDRASLAEVAVEELDSQVLILDDGFQHRRLRRDLDLVLIDATNPWGHGYLLPRGLLREPIQSLKRADLALLTRCDLAGPETVDGIRSFIERVAPGLPIAETVHQPRGWINASRATQAPDHNLNRPVAAFCGVGNPEAFRRTLEQLGLRIAQWRWFADHHQYSRADIDDLDAWARKLPPGGWLATTQKDLVKIPLDQLGERPLWALQIRMDVPRGKDILAEKLRGVVNDS